MTKAKQDNATHISQEVESMAVERVHRCVRMGLRENQFKYDAEVIKLIDDLGIDFVCQHACENTWQGGKECASGHCEWPDCHGTMDLEAGDEKRTCREAMRGYIEHHLGYSKPFLRTVK
jgi:hypothetical protein